MSALIYNPTSQAFEDAEIPKIDSGGVFVDAEGKVYDSGQWVDAWTQGYIGPNGELVPPMTSDITPIGEVIYSSYHSSGSQAYFAFDENNTTRWNSEYPRGEGEYIGYKFNTKTRVRKFSITPFNNGGNENMVKTFKLQASNDGAIWNDLTQNISLAKNYASTYNAEINNNNQYLYYRIYLVDSYYVVNGNTYSFSVREIQFYV